MNIDFSLHVSKMLSLWNEIVSGPRLTNEMGVINVKGDESIGMDIKIEDEFVKYLKESKLPVSIFSEESGIIPMHKNPEYLVVFDPLDGSTNYKIGKGLLPFGCLIAFYKGGKPNLKDIVSSGAIEFTKNLEWIYDGKNTLDMDDRRVNFSDNWQTDKHTPIYLDLYYREGYKFYSNLPGKISIRNTGSSIGNLSYLLSGVCAGMGSVCMRPEEIGSVYSLIKGSGGVVVDHNGKDLGEKTFDSNLTYPILGGVQKVIDFCIKEINN